MTNDFRPLERSYRELLSMEESERNQIKDKFGRENRSYVDFLLKDKAWIIVLGSSGQVYSYGREINSFPSEKDLRKIAEETQQFPFAYAKLYLPEEKAA